MFRSVGARGWDSPGPPDYAFDSWLSREHPRAAFERYCDDAVR
jgi:hypothetical protein